MHALQSCSLLVNLCFVVAAGHAVLLSLLVILVYCKAQGRVTAPSLPFGTSADRATDLASDADAVSGNGQEGNGDKQQSKTERGRSPRRKLALAVVVEETCQAAAASALSVFGIERRQSNASAQNGETLSSTNSSHDGDHGEEMYTPLLILASDDNNSSHRQPRCCPHLPCSKDEPKWSQHVASLSLHGLTPTPATTSLSTFTNVAVEQDEEPDAPPVHHSCLHDETEEVLSSSFYHFTSTLLPADLAALSLPAATGEAERQVLYNRPQRRSH